MSILGPFKLMTVTIVALVIVIGAEAGQVLAESFAAGEEDRMLAMVNERRAEHGIEPLEINDALRMVARRHTRDMVTSSELYHNPDLQADVDTALSGWTLIGENVGVGPSTRAVQDGFIDSPPHRRNVEEARFNLAGIGALASERGEVFYTQIFAERRGPPRPTTASAPAGPTADDVIGALLDVLSGIADSLAFWR